MRRSALLAVALFAVGCGSGSSTAPVSPPPPGLPTSDPIRPAPPAAADAYEMDPAKHVIPAAPVSGRLGGRPFTPDRVELQGNTLTFRQGKDFFADQEISVTLKLDAGQSAEGTKLAVKPSQKWHEGNVPTLRTGTRTDPKGIPDTKFVNDGYALTLELGSKAAGKVPGKIVLCLPDAGKSYLAGTFEAARARAVGEPLTAEDAPFIRGMVKHAGKEDQMLTAGYVGLVGKDTVSDLAGTTVPAPGKTGGWVQSTTNKPRVATMSFRDGTPRFDFVKLPPGKYLVYAKLKDGPVAWTWVDVKEGGQLTQDIALDAKAVGTAEVKVPADFQGKVMLSPAAAADHDPTGRMTSNLGFWLGLEADAKDGKATVTNVPAGKYTLFLSPGVIEPRGTIEVAAGKTATAEITAKKK